VSKQQGENMMDASIKAEWISDLISGEFEQTGGVLKGREGGYCCLGVLCEQAVRKGVIPPAHVDRMGWHLYGDESRSDVLPIEVQRWAGLESNTGLYGEEGSLAFDNDVRGYTFPQIAEVIATNF
jgi:hypothetical protein